MGSALVALLLAAPFPPTIGEPANDAWVNGTGVYLWWGEYEDDAGIAARNLRLEFRREDGGYGAFNDSQPWSRGRYTSIQFPVENERWCWRAIAINVASEESAPSDERCFRTDNSNPQSPAFVDGGAIVSDGLVVIEHSAATDTVSGVAGYVLELSNAPAGDFYTFGPHEPGVPLVTYVGEGQWYGWIRVDDFANNTNQNETGVYAVPITIVANDAGFVPSAPQFWNPVSNNYGEGIQWDAGGFAVLGVTHVVASFCDIETSCVWKHSFAGMPATQDTAWMQLDDEGTKVARIAVVIGGRVGPWSAPSQPLVLDRTPPPTPTNAQVSPMASRMPSFSLSWSGAADERSGLVRFDVEQHHLARDEYEYFQVAAPAMARTLTPALEGRYEYAVNAWDRAGNHSVSSNKVTVVFDRTGPHSFAPQATALPTDGGALVAVTWSAPTDELSTVASQELRENAVDGGSVVMPAFANAAARTVGPGRWTWQVRAVDSLGNQGDWSLASNAILVSGNGSVALGPSLPGPYTFQLECGVPFTTTLASSGDAPLAWTLLNGPPGLVLNEANVSWTPSAQGTFTAEVKLLNNVDSVTRNFTFEVSCASATDAGTQGIDGGSTMTTQPRRGLNVGCGCGALDASVITLLGVLLLSRRKQKRCPGA